MLVGIWENYPKIGFFILWSLLLALAYVEQ